MEKKTELLKTLEFLTSLGYDNVQGLSIGIKYDEITIRATFDGFSEREKKESEHQSNCNLPQVSKSDGIEREALLIAFFDYMIKNNNVTNMYTDKYMYIGNFLKSKQ